MSGLHTQFLDLTNGEGGERPPSHHPPPPRRDAHHNAYEQHNEQQRHQHQLTDHSEGTMESDAHDDGGHSGVGTDTHTHSDSAAHGGPTSSSAAAAAGGGGGGGTAEEEEEEDRTTTDEHHNTRGRTVTISSTATGGDGNTASRPRNIDPSTPGKVVETGREQTGRWTKEEHEAFLSALQMYGKEWKKVAAKVKTRTVVQTRTHAQKYFQKLQKTMEQTGLDDITHVEMGISSTAKATKKPGEHLPPQPAKKKGRPPGSGTMNRRSSSTTINAAQVISNLSNPAAAAGGNVPARHGFSTAAATVSGGDSDEFPTPYTSQAATRTWLSSTANTGGRGGRGAAMKIVAPDPYSSMKRGLPEPSPAATGKRKLAEIAAARMLAGVAGIGAATPPPQAAAVASAITATANDATTAMANDVMDDDGCPPTPPPTAQLEEDRGGGGRLNLKDAPLPPLFTDVDTRGTERQQVTTTTMDQQGKGGLTLQIVNPETLGVAYEQKRRRGNGEGSPVTPWEGQLKALVDGKQPTSSSGGDAPGSHPGKSNSVLEGRMMGTSTLHPVCGPGNCFNRSSLHKAVCDLDVAEVERQLNIIVSQDDSSRIRDLRRLDKAGYCPIHTACATRLGHPETQASVDLVDLLLLAGADASVPDNKGNTPLHWAARAGDREVAEKLLMKNCDFDAKNKDGESPLHWAMRSGRRGMDVASVLLDTGARPGILNKIFRRPIDVAADGFLDEPNSLASLILRDEQGQKVKKELKRVLKESSVDRKDSRTNFLIRSAYSRTLVLHHPECLEHHPKSETDWEAPDRVTSIMRRVLPSSDSTGSTETSGVFPHEITVSQEFDRAKLDLLSRVHSTEYLSFVNELSKDLERQLKESGEEETGLEDNAGSASFGSPPVVPFTPMVQRTMIKVDEDKVKCGMTSDTSFSVGSLKAARRAAGAVQHAVDCVLVGRNRNAFCVVRPPGHHAGINGLLEGGDSCGFCIFNNVAAGALCAIADDKLLCNRCAIVDIDVHHGNGTEEIVRKCHDPSKLFFFSIHLYDNDKRKGRSTGGIQYKFYPGTGNEDDLALNIINVPIVPLWKEPPPPPPVTSRTHNTRQKTRASASQDNTLSQEDSTSETGGTPRDNGSRASDAGSEIGSSYVASPRLPSSSASSGRAAYRQAIKSRLLPALRAFDPDLILISAGFDASKGDVGNARHERGRERMGLDLEPEDYAWTTRKILEIADICCQGRVVSVLEGGYGRTPATPQGQQPSGLDRTLFAECAIRHLHAMIDPYNTEKRFSS